MKKVLQRILLTSFILFILSAYCTAQQCSFELSNGKESATYFEAIQWYKNLDKASTNVLVKEMGMSDAGYPKQGSYSY
jgi:hypothetical protein